MYLFKNSRFAVVWTIVTIGLGGLLIYNSSDYFQTEFVPAFLIEKAEIAQGRIWSAAFYFHIVSSCIVLAIGAALFFTSLLRYRRIHVVFGYTYVNLVLWVAAPTGLIMSPYSKGGFWAAVGFAVTGLAWWWSTWQGYQAIRVKRMNKHIAWMVRSWCLSLSAISFRVIHIGIAFMGVDPTLNYVWSIWLSLGINLLFAEWFVARNFQTGKRDSFEGIQTTAKTFT
jgi:hypothetical protein